MPKWPPDHCVGLAFLKYLVAIDSVKIHPSISIRVSFLGWRSFVPEEPGFPLREMLGFVEVREYSGQDADGIERFGVVAQDCRAVRVIVGSWREQEACDAVDERLNILLGSDLSAEWRPFTLAT